MDGLRGMQSILGHERLLSFKRDEISCPPDNTKFIPGLSIRIDGIQKLAPYDIQCQKRLGLRQQNQIPLADSKHIFLSTIAQGWG
jgi:hypothetical protein